jgi:cysteine desulfurase
VSRRAFLDTPGPLHPAAREAVLAALDEGWADPRRLHHEARRAATLVEASRAVLAEASGCRVEELHVTPSHTASLHAGVAAVVAARRRVSERVVHSAVERGALLAAADRHEAVRVAVRGTGEVDLDAWAAALSADRPAALAALQHANGEVGTVQPLAAAREAARAAGVPLLVDAGSSMGHVPVPDDWDLLALDPTGWGGPAGVAALAVRAGVRARPAGPEDERPWAPGGVGVPQLVGAAAALRAVLAERDATAARHRQWLDRVRATVATIPLVDVPGIGSTPAHAGTDATATPDATTLPHVLTFSCLYVDGEALLTELDRRGVAVGSGSACTSATLEPSHVLAAMGVLTQGNVRLTLGWSTTEEDVDLLCAQLPGAVAAVREALGAGAL